MGALVGRSSGGGDNGGVQNRMEGKPERGRDCKGFVSVAAVAEQLKTQPEMDSLIPPRSAQG